jgi:hypothetical protein
MRRFAPARTLKIRPIRVHPHPGDTAMKSAFFPAHADVFRALSVPLCAAALLWCAAQNVGAAPRSEMVTPAHKPCVQRQGVARSAPIKAPAAAALAFPDRGHLPPSARVAVAAPQCVSRALS